MINTAKERMKDGINPDVILYSMLIDHLGKVGDIGIYVVLNP